jgi:hypothetical protein
MEVFVLKSLERLRSESSRRDTEFREAADLVIRASTPLGSVRTADSASVQQRAGDEPGASTRR